MPLKRAGTGTPFLRVWDEAKGKVAQLNITAAYAFGCIGKDGLTPYDLAVRMADWLTSSTPREPRPTTKQRATSLRATDAVKPAGKEAVLYSSSFDDKADLDAWSLWQVPHSGTEAKTMDWWIDTNLGALTQSSNIWGGQGAGTRALIGRPEWGNYVLSTTLTSYDDDVLGIVFRYQDENNYYRLFLDADMFVQLRIEKRRNGQWQTLDSIEEPYIPGLPVRYQIAVKGDTILVYANGKDLLAAADPDLPAGRVGLETNASDGLVVYDFEVFSLDGAAPATQRR